MANRQRAEARRKAQAKAARSEGGAGGKTWMWVTIAVVVVAAIVGVVIATGGDDSPAASDSTTASSDGGGSSLPDSQPVTVTGDKLPDYKAGDDSAAIGLTAPTVVGKNFNGKEVKLDASEGAYMVVFLAHWCPHCNAEVPRLLDWKHSGAVPADLKVIGVATAVSPTSVNYPPASWFSNKGWEWPVLVDESQGDGAAGTVAQAYGATGWPYIVIVGADGKVKARMSGEVEIADLQKTVDAALKG